MPSLSHNSGPQLLQLAREAIGARLSLCELSNPLETYLQEKAATFVTLMKDGELRGCMGSLEPDNTLLADLRANATSAAFRDPRFSPVIMAEFEHLRVEVSLLSSLEDLHVQSEEDALQKMRPAIDGLVLKWGPNRGTFLPQVWEQLPNPKDFLRHLMLKAGVSTNEWSSNMELWRYTVTKWKEGP